MAGFDVDTGMYPQANPNALTQSAGQFLGLANAGQQNQLLQTANKQSQQDLVKQQVGYLTSGFGALLSKPDLSPQDFLSFGQRALAEGIISPQTYQAEAANVQAAGNDPVKLRGLAQQYVARASDSAQQYALATGYTPAAGASPVQYIGPTGATITTTQRNFAAANGGNSLTAQQPQQPQQSAPSDGGNQLTGQSSTGVPSPTIPVPLAPIRQSNANAGAAGGIAGPTPQQQAQFAASGKQQQDDLTADAGYTANIVPLKKVTDLLPDVPLFGTGSEIPTQVAKVLATFGVPQAALQSKDSSELEKYLAAIARSSGAAPNAVAQLEAAITANPNMSSDRYAAKDVVGTMMALARMQHAKVAQAQAAGIPPEQYSTWAAKWAGAQDPRAYAFDFMDDKAKSALKAELKANPAEAGKFISSYNAAKTSGIFD